jgi:hypothetical protein
LPGADLSFFYGWFMGISPSLEAVAFDAIAYPGIRELEQILDSVATELPRDADRRDLMSVALGAVCDPDSRGHRYDFRGRPTCPACRSGRLSFVVDTEVPWPEPADAPTHAAWEGMDHQSRVAKIRAALGLDGANT